MENFDTEFIATLFNKEKTVEEVSLILQDMYPNKRGLSTRSLKRYCAKRGEYPKILLTTWLQRQSKRYVLEAGIKKFIR